jgi:endonuclease G, mitochondrial
MGDVRDRVQRARRQVMEEAFGRWVARWRTREANRTLVETKGPGAADPPRRRAAFQAREARREVLGLARVVERRIGTWDPVFFATSDSARAAARPVARLVEWGGEGFQPLGVATGFLVSSDLLITNWHVVPERSCAVGMYANFGHEQTDRGTAAGSLFALEPQRFFVAHERLDFALVAVRPSGARGDRLDDIEPTRLIGSLGKIQTGDPMNVIQHPSGGPRQFAVSNNRLVDILEADGFLHYESDTLQGSSGSPVFNSHWELVALHHCAVPAMRGSEILKQNGDPWNPDADDEDDIQWVANEGARISFIVAALRETRAESPNEQQLLDALLANVADPLGPATDAAVPLTPVTPVEVALPPSATRTPSLSSESGMSANVFNISGGSVTIHAGGANVAATAPAVVPAITPSRTDTVAPRPFVEKAQNFDPDYTARPGYDPEFLGVEIPLPEVDAAHRGDLFTVANYKEFLESARNVPKVDIDGLADDAPFRVDYHHYSLVTNRALRMAMFTASNVDYSEEARQDPRPRAAFGGESWRVDPRVPKQYQLVNADIYAPAQNLDRGHLVRREDSAWGAPGLDTEFANADTYHWTNCTPQHELFNQETPDGEEYRGRKGIWGEFEAQLQQELMNGGGQATILSGPVLYSGTRTMDFGRGEVVYPLKFWKVVVVPKSTARRPGLAAYGFVFDQSRVIREFGLGVETLELRKFARQAKPLGEIEALAGVRLPEIVRNADQRT